MSEIAFTLATRDDDAALRHLLATIPMPGRIRVRFQREPDYFAGCATMGPFTQVLVAKDGADVVGLACRVVRPLYVNGRPEDVGYLGQLRVHPRYRGRSLVARGFRKLRELHDDGRVRGYITTIIDGNRESEGVLVRHRRGVMPRYRPLDRLVTLAFAVPHSPRVKPRLASDEELPAAVAFLGTEGAKRNFFPVWRDEVRDLVLAFRNGEIAGVAGLWDQTAVKQTVVDGYDRLTTAARPIYNVAARIIGSPRLPRPGSKMRTVYGSFFCAKDGDPGIVRELIEQLLALAADRGHEILYLGFTESDPSLAAARTRRHIAYRAGMYTVTWDDGDDFHDRLDARPRYLELATL